MAGNTHIISMVFRATTENFDRVNKHLRAIQRTTGLLGSALGRLKIAAQFYVSFRIFSAIFKVVNALTNAIPNLIARGQQWLAVLDQLQDATGMTATQVSKIAFAAKVMGIDVIKLGRDISYLARNVVENEDYFKKYGIAVRDANGQLKGSYEIFQEVRRAMSSFGRQLLTAAAAQKFFSEGGRELVDLLTLTDRQWRQLMSTARRSGAIMTQAAITGAEAWKRAQNLLQTQIDIIGARILGGVAPVLIALTSGITAAIQDNMQSIINFVQRVIVVIAGFFSGLLGIELNLKKITKSFTDLLAAQTRGTSGARDYGAAMDEAARGSDNASKGIDRQTAALDRQIARLDRIQANRTARRQRQELTQDIAKARAELNALRNEHLFTSGMSLVEGELARQARAGDIIAAAKNVADAQKKLRRFDRDAELQDEKDRLQKLRDRLQKRAATITAASAGLKNSLSDMFQSTADPIGNALDKGTKQWNKAIGKFRKLLKGTAETGAGIREDLERIFLGEEVTRTTEGAPITYKTGERTGGLIKVIQDLSGHIISLIAKLTDLFGGPVADAAGDALDRLSDAMPDSDKGWLQNIADFIVVGLRASPLGQGVDSTLKNTGIILDKVNPPAPPGAPGPTAAPRPHDQANWTRPEDRQQERPAIVPAQTWIPSSTGPGLTDEEDRFNSPSWKPKPDNGDAQEGLWRRYAGKTSDAYKNAKEQSRALGALLGNTAPIKDGRVKTDTDVKGWDATAKVTVSNSGWGAKFDRIGKIDSWNTGQQVQVGNGAFAGIGTISQWTAGQLVAVRGSVGVMNNGWTASFDNIGTIKNWNAGQQVNVRSAGKSGLLISQWSAGTMAVKGDLTQIGSIGKIGRIVENVPLMNSQIGAIQRLKNLKIIAGAMLTNIGAIQKGLININVTGNTFKVFQQGGAVRKGQTVIGGEGGPEIFTAPAAGYIHSNTASKQMMSAQSRGGSMNVTLQLDAHATRLLLSGRAANTTTRAAVGV